MQRPLLSNPGWVQKGPGTHWSSMLPSQELPNRRRLSPMSPSMGARFFDRDLYIPEVWVDDLNRCAKAGIPAGRDMAAKPAAAGVMIEGVLDTGCKRSG